MKENKKLFAAEQQFSCPGDKSNKKQQGDKKDALVINLFSFRISPHKQNVKRERLSRLKPLTKVILALLGYLYTWVRRGFLTYKLV